MLERIGDVFVDLADIVHSRKPGRNRQRGRIDRGQEQ